MQALLGSIFGPKKQLHDLSGRVAVVTGGAFGIGYEISRAFVEAKAKVIMVNRNWDHGSAAIRSIKKDFGSDAPVEWIHCDLGNLEETRKVFCTIREKEERLDILVLSAGINANQFALDHDNIEHIFGVNWLGNFYATNLLYPLMRRTSKMPSTPAPRIVMESSEMILGVKYGLVERVIKPNGDNIYAIAVHPGTVNTAIQQQLKDAYPGWFGSLLTNLSLSVGRSPEQGACSAVYAASSPEIEKKGWNGVYLTDPGKLGKESSQARDPELGAALWKLSEELVKEKLGEEALADWHS